MDKPDLVKTEDRAQIDLLSACRNDASIRRVIHHGELRKPTLQDLLEQAYKAANFQEYRDYEEFGVMVVEMFGSDTSMAIALISQIHALQEQIRRVREQADSETRIVLDGAAVAFIREWEGRQA